MYEFLPMEVASDLIRKAVGQIQNQSCSLPVDTSYLARQYFSMQSFPAACIFCVSTMKASPAKKAFDCQMKLSFFMFCEVMMSSRIEFYHQAPMGNQDQCQEAVLFWVSLGSIKEREPPPVTEILI